MELAKDSVQHLERLLGIAKELASEGIALYGHEHHPLSFGSFSVEFGKPHHLVLCHWDGKESVLSISFAKVKNQIAPRRWTHDAYISLPDGEGVYEEIASNVKTMVAT
jgi:hypothetical protein